MKKKLIIGIGAAVTAITGTLITATLVSKEKDKGLKVISGAVATMAAILAAGCGVAIITDEEENNYDTYHVEFENNDDENNYSDNENNYSDNENNNDDGNNYNDNENNNDDGNNYSDDENNNDDGNNYSDDESLK